MGLDLLDGDQDVATSMANGTGDPLRAATSKSQQPGPPDPGTLWAAIGTSQRSGPAGPGAFYQAATRKSHKQRDPGHEFGGDQGSAMIRAAGTRDPVGGAQDSAKLGPA